MPYPVPCVQALYIVPFMFVNKSPESGCQLVFLRVLRHEIERGVEAGQLP